MPGVSATPAVPSEPVVALVTEPPADLKLNAAPEMGLPLESVSYAVVQPVGMTCTTTAAFKMTVNGAAPAVTSGAR